MHFTLLKKVKGNPGTKNWLLIPLFLLLQTAGWFSDSCWRPRCPPAWTAVLSAMCPPDLGQLSCSTELHEDCFLSSPQVCGWVVSMSTSTVLFQDESSFVVSSRPFYLRNDFPKERYLNIFLQTSIHSSLGDSSMEFCIPHLNFPLTHYGIISFYWDSEIIHQHDFYFVPALFFTKEIDVSFS